MNIKNNKDELVSVVVPIYNVEKYLDRCVESIVNQTYKQLEIIMIDDGSTDRSSEICEKWKRQDDRIIVIHKKNQGLGMARNTGLDYATGKYICFFDSDDYIESQTIEKLYKYCEEYNAELVCFGFVLENADGSIKDVIRSNKNKVFEGKDQVRKEFIPGMIGFNPDTGETLGIWMNMWGAIYSTELLKRIGWRCESERSIISEDIYSLLELYDCVNKAVVISESFYHYCCNEVSLTNTYREDRYKKIKHFYYECIRLCEEKKYPEVIKRELSQPFLNFSMAALKQVVRSETQKKSRKFKMIICDSLMQEILLETRKDRFGINKRVLFFFMRNRCIAICYILFLIKTRKG